MKSMRMAMRQLRKRQIRRMCRRENEWPHWDTGTQSEILRHSSFAMKPIAIVASGMVTGVGHNAATSCAAIRCAIDNFSETRFMDQDGEWIVGSQVQFEQSWRGLPKLVHMVAPAI